MLSDSLIEQYREWYRKHYGVEISRERAEEEGTNLLNLALMLVKHSGHQDTATKNSE